MMIITSLSPSHSNAPNQHNAIKSWQPYSDQIFSMNCEKEIDILKQEKYEGIEFLQTDKTIQYYYGKPLVTISAMMDIAKIHGKDLLIVNSDIELCDLPELKKDGITLFSRYDWTDLHTKANAKIFPYGFDVFYIPKQFLKIFPPSIFAMGAAWHDLATPYHAILNKIPVYYPKGIFAYHKFHETQYPVEEWYDLGRHFRWHFKLSEKFSVEQVVQMTMKLIKSKLKQ